MTLSNSGIRGVRTVMSRFHSATQPHPACGLGHVPAQRFATHPIDRLARVKSVARHDAGVQVEVNRGVRNVATRRRPAGQSPVVAKGVGTEDAAQRLGQEREKVHRRQRCEDDVARQAFAQQPVGKRGAVPHGAGRRHLADDIVDAGDDDGNVRRAGGSARSSACKPPVLSPERATSAHVTGASSSACSVRTR